MQLKTPSQLYGVGAVAKTRFLVMYFTLHFYWCLNTSCQGRFFTVGGTLFQTLLSTKVCLGSASFRSMASESVILSLTLSIYIVVISSALRVGSRDECKVKVQFQTSRGHFFSRRAKLKPEP